MSAQTVFRTLRLHSGRPTCHAQRWQLVRNFRSSTSRKEQIHDANAETLAKAISKENSGGKVVLVDFYADWCGPCKMLSPILEKLTAGSPSTTRTGSGRTVDLVTVDTDTEIELAQKYKVRSLPTVIAFKDGEVVEQFVGALNEAGVRKVIEEL